MPFGDGTGPRGMGSMTGRGVGYCAGFGRPGFANPVPRRGRRWSGFGWRRAYRYPYIYWPQVNYPRFGYPHYGRGYPFSRNPYIYP